MKVNTTNLNLDPLPKDSTSSINTSSEDEDK